MIDVVKPAGRRFDGRLRAEGNVAAMEIALAVPNRLGFSVGISGWVEIRMGMVRSTGWRFQRNNKDLETFKYVGSLICGLSSAPST